MASFKFGSNAFNSPVGQRIEKVTDSSKATEDWALIVEICDIINETNEGPKDAVKAIRKRLGNTKNYKSILYTLTVTEACVKNCGKRFHVLVSTKEFMGDLTKIVVPKGSSNHCPQVVQEKILSLIQSWADAFRNAPDLQHTVQCYEQLRAQGIEFPAQDLDTLAPIYTPARSTSEDTSAVPKPTGTEPSEQGRINAPISRQRAQTAPPRHAVTHGPVQPSPESLAKLRSQLDVVEENVRVMSEMLIELMDVEPSLRNQDDVSLLIEINKTCRQMQLRVVDLIGKVANEEVTGELLRINDDLNNVFIRYDRFDRSQKALVEGSSKQKEPYTETEPPNVAATSTTAQVPSDENLLIDLGESNKGASAEDKDDFDMFAQSRSSTFEASRMSGSTYDDNTTGVPVESSIASAMSAKGPYPKPAEEASGAAKTETGKTLEEDIEDVEEWLKDTDINFLEQVSQTNSTPATTAETGSTNQPISSAEFDRFLSERANVGPQRVSSSRTTNAVPRQMEMIAGEQRKDDPFAL